RRHLQLPDTFYEAIRQGAAHGASSTRVELTDDAILAVLNDVHFFALDTTDASTVTVCANDRMLVTARTTPLRSVDRLRAAVKTGGRFRSTAELVAHLLRDQADVLVQIVREATIQVDATEDKLFTGRSLSSRPMLGSQRRVLVRLQRLLAPEPAALFRLLTRPPAWVRPADVDDLRQSAEELAAAVADSAALVERVRLLQEELIALINEETNRTLFVLTVVTVLALPLTIVPGLLGMNVGGLPLAQHDRGFLIVVAILAVITVAGASWAFGRRHSQ
ncbi:MAG: CorA family divalent cation transporter, partial [Vicinamibacterales bacterium]